MTESPCLLEDCLEVRDDVKVLSAELTRTRDLYMRLLRDRSDEARRSRSAARRIAERDRLSLADIYVHQAVRERGGDTARYLVELVAGLPDTPRPTDVTALRVAAHSTRLVLDGAPPAVDVFAEAGAEVARIRGYVITTGQALHAAHGRSDVGGPGQACGCVGCELIIGLDDLPEDVAVGDQT